MPCFTMVTQIPPDKYYCRFLVVIIVAIVPTIQLMINKNKDHQQLPMYVNEGMELSELILEFVYIRSTVHIK